MNKATQKSMKILPKYDPAKIEKKWQKKWAKDKLYKSQEVSKEKFFVLDMFPYPSGEGLHVGHPKGYIATDIISRMNRMQGKSVLHPMGFDAFGLPAENYAIKTKTNPIDSVGKNVERYKKQLEILGFDYDWSREVNTTDPAYYKWTQWIFLQLYKKGLAYESFEPINWCPSCKTGLANEDVEDGRCERCGTVVEKKPMRQWVLKITDYAERLLGDLDIVREPIFTNTVGTDAFRPDMPVAERHVVHCLIKHWKDDSYLCMKWKKNDWRGFVIGGIEDGESVIDTAVRESIEETGYKNIEFKRIVGKMTAEFYQQIKKENRRAFITTVYLELKDGEQGEIPRHEKEIQDMEWVPASKVRDFVNRTDLKYEWDVFTGAVKQPTLLDWPNSIKEAQRNWIGKSEGALIKFSISNDQGSSKSQKHVEVFTTRPDTLFGVTYIVLAPEHALVEEFSAYVENKKEVEAYITQAKLESEIERTDAKKEKTGVELKGIKAINPANGEQVPVWIADYVLADYGTGAVMAVPAHDERDFAFAKKFNLPVKHVIAPYLENKLHPLRKDLPIVRRNHVDCILYNPKTEKYAALKWAKEFGWTTLIGGGVDDGEDVVNAGIRELKEESGYQNIKFIRNVGKCFGGGFATHKGENRFSENTALYFELIDETSIDVSDVEKRKHALVWLDKSEMADFLNVESSLYLWNLYLNDSSAFTGEGILIDSQKFSGRNSDSIRKEITVSVGGKWVTKFKLRDWVFSRQRYWGEPIPLIHCSKCGIVPVPEKDLPVKLPKVKSYEPTGTGESPLAQIHKWVNVKCPKCKSPAKRETNTMPQWAGSSWYYLRYMDPKNKASLVDPKKEKYWAPVDLYVGGAEHATRHLIYARFWHKFLHDIGVVSTVEPFIKLQHVGLIMGEDGRKMSKRFGNVVNPDDVVKSYGADTVRLYEMFMGPFDQQIAWSTSSMVGTRRFIEKVWRLYEKIGVSAGFEEDSSLGVFDRTLHKAIKKVTTDIGSMSFNTAISTLMITVNELEKAPSLKREQFEILLKIIAPFAPHISEELWRSLGNKTSIHISSWPTCDETLIVDEEINIIVQINGKVRANFKAKVGSDEAHIEKIARELPEVKKWIEGKEVKKVIIIKNKLVSIVVG